MITFDVSKNWVILLPVGKINIEKAAGDLARYIGLLASIEGDSIKAPKPLPLLNAHEPMPDETIPVIILNCEDKGTEQNGFSWRANPDRIEIFGESVRGLCNGIYNFLEALGLSWPEAGQEKLPTLSVKTQAGIPLATNKVHVPSYPLKRFIAAEEKTVNDIFKNTAEFIEWAARQRYDALVFPLSLSLSLSLNASGSSKLKQLKEYAGAYSISIEAGGRDISLLVPRMNFFLHRDFFRMEDGKRVKQHHFCSTSPGAIRIATREARKYFQAAQANVYHLWPDRGAETAWCSCPSCRAFTPPEQNRMIINIAADVLSSLNPKAIITYYETSSEGIKIPIRKNVLRLEELPDCY